LRATSRANKRVHAFERADSPCRDWRWQGVPTDRPGSVYRELGAISCSQPEAGSHYLVRTRDARALVDAHGGTCSGGAADNPHRSSRDVSWCHAGEPSCLQESEHRAMTEPGNLPLDEKRAGLPQVFTPARAAEALRAAGLQEMTECALRTRAYRRQIPFHLNGRRIFFTMEDLREISQGVAYRPEVDKYPEQGPPHKHDVPTLSQPAARRKAPQVNDVADGQWRARRPRGGQLGGIPLQVRHGVLTSGNSRWGGSTACALSAKDLAGVSRQPSMRTYRCSRSNVSGFHHGPLPESQARQQSRCAGCESPRWGA
jgi:hypothetical protein